MPERREPATFRALRRPREAPHASGRGCGECTLCCTVLRVDALAKLAGEPCRHLRADRPGCALHRDAAPPAGAPRRPRICTRYRCLWLQGGLDEADRPDRLGAVLDLVGEAGGTLLEVREAEPGAAERSPRLAAIVERFRAAVPVRITDVAGPLDRERPARLLLPAGVEQRFAGDRVTTLRPGAPPESRRLGWAERALRRLRVRHQQWRIRRLRRRLGR